MHLHLEITHSPTQMIQSKKILGNKTTKKLRSHCSLVHIQRAISQEQAYNTTSKSNTLLINVYIWVGWRQTWTHSPSFPFYTQVSRLWWTLRCSAIRNYGLVVDPYLNSPVVVLSRSYRSGLSLRNIGFDLGE